MSELNQALNAIEDLVKKFTLAIIKYFNIDALAWVIYLTITDLMVCSLLQAFWYHLVIG